VLVQNNSDKAVKAVVQLTSSVLTVTGGKQEVTLPAKGLQVVNWKIKAIATGAAVYTASVQAGSNSDAEEKTLTVLPAGLPRITTSNGQTAENRPFTHVFTKGAGSTVANLNVSLPGVLPAFQGLLAFDALFYFSPWTASATVVMNTAMLEYATAIKAETAFIESLKEKIKYAVSVLVASQLPSGGWGWFTVQSQEANLYFSVSCLRALAEAKRAGFEVSATVLKSAFDFIVSKRNPAGLWSAKGAYFWEAFNADTDNALSAEAFEVLTMAAPFLVENTSGDLLAVRGKILSLLEKGSAEPAVIAAALMGLMYWDQADGNAHTDITSGLKALLALKRTGYWEPHWYHAFGGMVELNARIVELLAAVDFKGYEGIIRETATWLLSTRNSWGAWHNEVGTANAVRALLKIAARSGAGSETGGQIVVSVNGKNVVTVPIDPADPYLSAAKLKYFEITPWLVNGENIVAVSYSGNQ